MSGNVCSPDNRGLKSSWSETACSPVSRGRRWSRRNNSKMERTTGKFSKLTVTHACVRLKRIINENTELFFFFFYIFNASHSVAVRRIDRVVTGVLNKDNGNKHNRVCYAYTSKFLLVWICANISGEHSIFSTVTHYHSYKCQPGMQLTSIAANTFWEWILHKLAVFMLKAFGATWCGIASCCTCWNLTMKSGTMRVTSGKKLFRLHVSASNSQRTIRPCYQPGEILLM